MPQTCHAWLEDQDRSGAAMGLAAIADDLIVTSGDNLRLRHDMRLIALMYGWTEFTAYAFNQAKISCPTIANNPLRITKGVALNYLNEGQIYDFRDAPLDVIRAGDNVTVEGYEEDEAGVAHYLGVVVVVSDGAIPKESPLPVTHIHRCTATATTAGAWTKLALTEQDALPAGVYHMLGARVEHASLVAARFLFKEIEARPAVIPVSRAVDHVHSFSSFWGKPIPLTMPDGLPKVEVLEVTGSGTVELELYLNGPRQVAR